MEINARNIRDLVNEVRKPQIEEYKNSTEFQDLLNRIYCNALEGRAVTFFNPSNKEQSPTAIQEKVLTSLGFDVVYQWAGYTVIAGEIHE